jgi:hypothetical protein
MRGSQPENRSAETSSARPRAEHAAVAIRSVPELRVAAAAGKAYFSCERLRDDYGRLLFGIGARLTDRELDAVNQFGQGVIAASPVAVDDGPRLQADVERIRERCSRESADSRMPDLPNDVVGALSRLRSLCPLTANVAASARPLVSDLGHGITVGRTAVRLMEAFDRHRTPGTSLPYRARMRQETFTAGVVHDVGRWNEGVSLNHAKRGADLIRRMSTSSIRMEPKARVVGRHHDVEALLAGTTGDSWERHQVLPLAIAEAICECEQGQKTAVAGLAEMVAVGPGRGLVVAACEVVGTVPSRAIVMRSQPLEGTELAVCLQGEPSLKLLRFARQREDGDYDPLFNLDASESTVAGFAFEPMEGESLRVVSVMAKDEFDRRFGGYVETARPEQAVSC